MNLLRRLVGGTTVSRAPDRGLRGTRPPQWSRSCQSWKLDPQVTSYKMDIGLILKWTTDSDTTRECMHHTPRIPNSRACYTGASQVAVVG